MARVRPDRDERAVPSRRNGSLIVAATVLVLSIPYALGGPNLLADDWVYVRNGYFNGVLHAAGPRQVQRPGATVLYDITFGLIGAHPVALYAAQVALWMAAAVALYLVMSRFVSQGRAFAIAMVWAVLPTHNSLEHWSSTGQVLLAFVLLCGAIWVLDSARSTRDELLAAALFAAAILTYELVAPAAIAAAIGVPRLRRRMPSRLALIVGPLLLGGAVLWVASHVTVYSDYRGKISVAVALRSLSSLGLDPTTPLAKAALVLVLLAIGVGGFRIAVRRDQCGQDEALVVVGAGIVVIGLVPLWNFSTNLLGLFDRLTLISGVGIVLVLVGGVGMLGHAIRQRPAVVIASVIAVALIAVPVRISRNRDYVDAGDAALAEAERLAGTSAPHSLTYMSGPVAETRGLSGLTDGWNTTAAVQLLRDDPTIRIYVEVNGELTGA